MCGWFHPGDPPGRTLRRRAPGLRDVVWRGGCLMTLTPVPLTATRRRGCVDAGVPRLTREPEHCVSRYPLPHRTPSLPQPRHRWNPRPSCPVTPHPLRVSPPPVQTPQNRRGRNVGGGVERAGARFVVLSVTFARVLLSAFGGKQGCFPSKRAKTAKGPIYPPFFRGEKGSAEVASGGPRVAFPRKKGALRRGCQPCARDP